MIKKLIVSSLTSTVLLSTLAVAPNVDADEFDQAIEENRNTINESEERVHTLEDTISTLREKVLNAEEELGKLEQKIDSNEAKIKETVNRLEEAHTEMTLVQEEIAELNLIIEKRTDQLEQQARKIQVNGQPVNYIEFIIEAESLTDIIGRLDIVSNLISSNRKLVRAQIRDMEAVVEKEERTEQTIVQQNALAAELEVTAENLEEQHLEKEVLIAQIASERATAQSERDYFLAQRAQAEQAVAQLLTAREEAAQAAREAEEQRRIQQLEEERAAEAERALSVTESSEPPEESNQSASESDELSTSSSTASETQSNASSSSNAQQTSSANSNATAGSESQSTPAASVSSGSSSSSESAGSTASESSSNTGSSAQASSSSASSAQSSENATSQSSSSASESTPSESNTSTPKPAPAPTPAPNTGTSWSSLSPHATRLLGTPYLYGGSTASGLDCSGFTSLVFRQVGISLPRTAAGQYASAQKVSNPQPGDLVFFSEGGSRVTHVGIYTGGGQFIGSQTSTGVAYTSATTGYWGSRLVGYGRY